MMQSIIAQVSKVELTLISLSFQSQQHEEEKNQDNNSSDSDSSKNEAPVVGMKSLSMTDKKILSEEGFPIILKQLSDHVQSLEDLLPEPNKWPLDFEQYDDENIKWRINLKTGNFVDILKYDYKN